MVPFTAQIFTPAPDDTFPFGWFATADGSVTAFQPNVAHLSYPVNDHPADKATYTFHLDVPAGITAVANGVATGASSAGGRTVFSYEERSPMASELVQATVGDIAVIDRGSAAGVRTARRRVEHQQTPASSRRWRARRRTCAGWSTRSGPYPFENYGVLAADQLFFYALETQTLSLHAELFFDPRFAPGVTGQRWFYEPIMVHELAHQWFGDSVAPERWSDVWLNEGHATWYEREWEQEKRPDRGERLRLVRGVHARPVRQGQPVPGRVRAGRAADPQRPVRALQRQRVRRRRARPLRAPAKVGDPAFRAIERAWAQRKRGESVGTDDFIALASDVAGQDLSDVPRCVGLRRHRAADARASRTGHRTR